MVFVVGCDDRLAHTNDVQPYMPIAGRHEGVSPRATDLLEQTWRTTRPIKLVLHQDTLYSHTIFMCNFFAVLFEIGFESSRQTWCAPGRFIEWDQHGAHLHAVDSAWPIWRQFTIMVRHYSMHTRDSSRNEARHKFIFARLWKLVPPSRRLGILGYGVHDSHRALKLMFLLLLSHANADHWLGCCVKTK